MSTSHRTHGLAGEHTAPDWPPLRTAEVAALLETCPQAGTLRRIAWHSPRPLSAAALVETAQGRLFVKRHHQRVRTAAMLAEEHRFAAHLRERGVPVPALLADAAGHTAIARGEWTFEIQQAAPGIDLYRHLMSWQPPTRVHHAHAAGRALATLHRAAADYHAPQRSTHVLVARSEVLAAADPVATLEGQLPARPGLAAYLATRPDWKAELAAVFAPWQARLQPRLATLPVRWTHGDWHVSNLFWSSRGDDAQVSAVLDFGLCARSFALFDLATAIERNAIAWLDLDGVGARADVAHALLAGYGAVLPLAADDVALVADLLPLVHVDFALSEVAYFHAITGSTTNANIAWNTFLRGHAAWFGTPAGRTLLDALRDNA